MTSTTPDTTTRTTFRLRSTDIPRGSNDPRIVTASGPEPFATLNRLVEPWARAGVAAPLPLPVGWHPGLVVLEVVGRKSGRIIRVPLIGAASREFLLITTARGSSQWVRNLARMPSARVWLRGRLRSARVWQWNTDAPQQPDSPRAARVLQRIAPTLDRLGLHGALLELERC